MAKPFKFRYVNEIVGGFVLLTVLMVVVSVFLIAGSKRWFTSMQKLVLRIPAGQQVDLRPGTDVFVGGTVAGSILTAAPDPSDPPVTVATIQLPSDFMKSIHVDSKVEIKRSLGGVGDAFIKITGGDGKLVQPGAIINILPKNIETSPAELAQQIVREQVVPLLESVRKITDSINDPEGNVQKTIGRAHHIVSSVDNGEGLAGRLINDRELGNQIAALLPKLNEALATLNQMLVDMKAVTTQLPQVTTSINKSLAEVPALVEDLHANIKKVNAITADIQKTTASLPETTKVVNQTLGTIPGLVLQTQETLRQLQRLLEGAQRSWLLKGSVPPEEPAGSRISADRVTP